MESVFQNREPCPDNELASYVNPMILPGQFGLEAAIRYDFAVNMQLNAAETRVLGALIEKESTTPECYPLSLNALVNACNQKSNRETVMNLDEDAVRAALRSLSDQGLVRSAAVDSRVAKYEHRLNETYNFHRHEIALLCVLLLRGPQTPGELRTRTERMYSFDSLDSVHSALQLLAKREPPLVTQLSRQPGTKEARFVQLLSGAPGPLHATTVAAEQTPENVLSASGLAAALERIARLESELARLNAAFDGLSREFADFRKQFQ